MGLALATSSCAFSSERIRVPLIERIFQKKLPYQTFKRDLEEALNDGDLQKAKSLIENASGIRVPMTQEVLKELKHRFNHDYEIYYLLFANKKGIIDHVEYPKQDNMSRGVSPDYEDIKKRILEQEQKGRTYVGDYHTHPSTREKILRFREEFEISRRSQPDNLFLPPFEGNTPSDGDIDMVFPNENTHMWKDPFYKRWKTKPLIRLIGGLTYPNFEFRIRAFAGLGIRGSRLDLSPQGVSNFRELEQQYEIAHGHLFGYVEFSVRSTE